MHCGGLKTLLNEHICLRAQKYHLGEKWEGEFEAGHVKQAQ